MKMKKATRARIRFPVKTPVRPRPIAIIWPVPAAICVARRAPTAMERSARKTRPPAGGNAGIRLKRARKTFAPRSQTRAVDIDGAVGGILAICSRSTAPPVLPTTKYSPTARPRFVSGPTNATSSSCWGFCGGFSIRDTPPIGRRRISRTVQPNAWATRLWASSCTTTQAKRQTIKRTPNRAPRGPCGTPHWTAPRARISPNEAWTRMSMSNTRPMENDHFMKNPFVRLPSGTMLPPPRGRWNWARPLCQNLDPMTNPRTLFQKIWDSHVVAQQLGAPAILYIDRQLVHEVTSPQAFTGLRARGLKVRRPDRTVATEDHSIPTRGPVVDEMAAAQLRQLDENCREFGIPLHRKGSGRQGVVHVIGPELGLPLPGMTIVCGDSHTATHGAFGALAFGIGTSEVEHVLASQCLLQNRPKTFEVRVEGRLAPGVSAKVVILGLVTRLVIGGGTGHVIEYTGDGIRALDMEQRMTVCNMTIEAGARAGMVAPDDTTVQYLVGREFAPKGAAWDAAVTAWRKLPTDPGAAFDQTLTLDAASLAPRSEE